MQVANVPEAGQQPGRGKSLGQPAAVVVSVQLADVGEFVSKPGRAQRLQELVSLLGTKAAQVAPAPAEQHLHPRPLPGPRSYTS
ncbi:hypothetical protein [Hymenobacter sp. BT491]|uniref:hypothetical protein n=1 Tax=Hymenobacter sp. BT491 TaxID=2766779 RepID=UPI001653757D|nr:hypothetical protein [Hymenobacter sp. BT491]MBC6992126.1 hypothetical protein [Hymenobacter sp. BT491]